MASSPVMRPLPPAHVCANSFLLDVLDELSRLKIEYVSFRENIDTGAPLGRAVVVIIGAIAELERNLIIEQVAEEDAMRRTGRIPRRISE
jgi:DNA invertase Pin-like site-specific DNA recombinase